MRRLARTVTVLLLVVVAVLCLSGSASAAQRTIDPECLADPRICLAGKVAKKVTEGCKEAPVPAVPGRGLTGFFGKEPGELPLDEDPFADDAKVSIYDVYGYAGLDWTTYDLGCGSDLARHPDAMAGTAAANWVVQLPQSWVAATAATLGAAYDSSFLSVLDPLVERVVSGLKEGVFERWAWLVMAALGSMLIAMSRRKRVSESAAAIGWALLVMMLVTMVFRWPLEAGHAADRSSAAALAGIDSGLNGTVSGSAGDAAAAHMHESLLYETWLAGTFGSTDSEAATTYGPLLFDASALTWREAAVLRDDPERGRKIVEAKQAKFAAVAEKVKAEDPDAYEYLTGKRSFARVGYAFLAIFGALCAVPFLFVSALLTIAALLIVRFGVMLFPAVATLGLFPTMRGLVTGIGNTAVAALFNAVVFGAGSSVFVLVMGVVMTAEGIAGWLRIVLMLVSTIIMWVLLRPFRRLTRMVSGDDLRGQFASAVSGPGQVARAAGRLTGHAARIGLAAASGGAGAGLATSVAQESARPGPAPHRAEAEPDVTVTRVASAPRSTVPVQRAPLPANGRRELAGPEPATPTPLTAGMGLPRVNDDAESLAPTGSVRRHLASEDRPGDRGEVVEGVVLPPTRYESED